MVVIAKNGRKIRTIGNYEQTPGATASHTKNKKQNWRGEEKNVSWCYLQNVPKCFLVVSGPGQAPLIRFCFDIQTPKLWKREDAESEPEFQASSVISRTGSEIDEMWLLWNNQARLFQTNTQVKAPSSSS